MLLSLIVGFLFSIRSSSQDQSVSAISGQGWQFIPADTSHPPLLTCTTKNVLHCQLECNKLSSCRTFDFDGNSRQCRLWDADTTTGSIVASPSKPQSSVGTIQLSASNYVHSHNQSCDKCALSRYETCDTNSSTCQCPSNTFWNGSMCLIQYFQDQVCSQSIVCRSGLNLTCEPSCDQTYRCSVAPVIGIGQTVAGSCNGTTGSSNGLISPWGIYVSPFDGILYLADYDGPKYQAFAPFSRTGLTLLSTGLGYPEDVFVDSSGTIYMTDYYANGGTIFLQRAGINLGTIPRIGQSTISCYLTGLYSASGITVDSSGNIYVMMPFCRILVKWTPNATAGVLIAGQVLNPGSAHTQFSWPRFTYLDEDRSALYVTDGGNNRVERFMIGGSATGVSVAGNNGAGTGLNQLNDPSGCWVTRDGQTLYVADSGNNRVMKWTIGATQGSIVAGSVSGTAGSTSQLFNYPGDVALDPTETYIYVSDYYNHRVQRFRLH